MSRLTLSALFKSKQQKRLEAETFNPRKAPHRPLVTELIRAHLPPLQLRLRSDVVEDLVLRILELEPTPVPFSEEPEAKQLFLLVLRTQQAIHQLAADSQFLARRYDNLGALLRATEDPEEARLIMIEYLGQTVHDPRKLREDIKALKRYFGLDAIREREEHERQRLASCIELGTLFIAKALEVVLTHPDESQRIAPVVFCSEAETDRFLAEIMAQSDRWQTRLAAADGLHRLCRFLDEAGEDLTDRTDLLDTATETLTSRDEHPWVRAKAVELAMAVHPQRGEGLLLETLRGDREGQPQNEFLVRRLLVDKLIELVPKARAAAILDALIGHPDTRDPAGQNARLDAVGISKPERSEHVRMGIAQVVIELPPSDAIARLRSLAGLDGHTESSPRVRAQALISARKLASGPAANTAVREAAAALMLDVLINETHTLPLQCACDELAELAADMAGNGADEQLHALAPAWIDALLKRSRDPKCQLPIAEVSAAAADRIARELSSERRLATLALRELVDDIRPGQSRTIAMTDLPKPVVEQCKNPRALGRILADISRTDYGLVIKIARQAITIWRGDQWRRRVWRVIHELRNPAPNKRQAFYHTIGRYYRGEVRAHPGRMDEQTATTVPGERVYVDAEGSWGRHLPTVDDLLDMPLWRPRPVYICSSYGVTTLTPARSFLRRVYSRIYISWRYQAISAIRQNSIASDEPQQRQNYLRMARDRFGIDVSFRAHEFAQLGPGSDNRANPAVEALFPSPAVESSEALTTAAAGASASAGAVLGPIASFREWLDANLPYFRSPTQNSQTALALYIGSMVMFYVVNAYLKRRKLERARNSIPLCVGGWGTRGKSGTERLKAGLFHGLGFEIFVKTTGCEAMLMHAPPGQKPLEIFIYRPYDKATIWEQYRLVTLAAGLQPDVFMWECMALNPRYVALLEHDWMHDDIITLTNAYPDHEDIQGPAGINVAQVITQFISFNSTLITSEVNFLPLFGEVCRERNTRMIVVSDRDAELIADDLLDLFPYREHPRNITLVTKLAEQYGLDPMLAQVTMAENVIPDLGVLKAYPTVRVRGRTITFMNGMSANERTGCLVCWRRMGLDKLEAESSPDQSVITVVNNRADRISRSEVFARIIVRDINVDRHVLIGTNIKGLRHFIMGALAVYLSEIIILDPEHLTGKDTSPVLPRKRLVAQMARLRIPPPTPANARRKLEIYAKAIDCAVDPNRAAELDAMLAKILTPELDASVSFAEVRGQLEANGELTSLIESVLIASPAPRPADEDILKQLSTIETVEPPVREDVLQHFIYHLATMVIRGRLEARLERVLQNPSPEAGATFLEAFLAAYREMFIEKLVIVESPETTGDQIINLAARSVPPGTHINLMGIQNIKGTGLDFVYRWIAVDLVVTNLLALQSERSDRRIAALREIEGFEDHGVIDTGMARVVFAAQPVRQPNAEELALRERIRAKLDRIYTVRMALLRTQSKRDNIDKVARVFEGMVDYLDSIRRYRRSKQIMQDLVDKRISHGRASLEMRQLMARQKGGWLAKGIKRWKQARKERNK